MSCSTGHPLAYVLTLLETSRHATWHDQLQNVCRTACSSRLEGLSWVRLLSVTICHCSLWAPAYLELHLEFSAKIAFAQVWRCFHMTCCPNPFHSLPLNLHLSFCDAEPRAVRYSDLGGIDAIRQDIQELIENPLRHPEVGTDSAVMTRPHDHEHPRV